jgi:peptidoglycan hydrolase-like protein with peptidoglycan-binding domain
MARTVAAVLVALAVGVTVVVVITVAGDDADSANPTTSGATAQVEQRTLTSIEEVGGTLDFGEAHSLTAGRTGTMTSVAEPGSVVERNGELLSIDQQPTVLLTGDLPLFRDLEAGIDDGLDVLQLEYNLAALGFTEGGALSVDEQFDAVTESAVEAWQEARGVEVTGRVARGDAVFLPGNVRIADELLDVGATVEVGTPVLDYTGSTRAVRVQLPVDQADLAQVDDKVTVTLPDGTDIDGTVARVAGAATSSGPATGASDGGEAGGGGEAGDGAALELTIALEDPAAAQAYTTASVDVLLTRSQREDVLTVPVTALLALRGGGYAVEVPAGDGAAGDTASGDSGEGATRLVEVEPGMFADGFVEITGDGIAEGTEVVVPE